MGDRAVVVFKDNEVHEIAVYLHWDGYRVEELIRGAAPRMRAGDASYAAARFIGHCHEQIEGALSLGVYGLSPQQMQDIATGHAGRLGHGDNGVWLVDVCTAELTHFDTEWSNPASPAFSPPGLPELRGPPLELFRGSRLLRDTTALTPRDTPGSSSSLDRRTCFRRRRAGGG